MEKFIVLRRNFRVDILPEFVKFFKKTEKHKSCRVYLFIMLLSDEKGKSRTLIREPTNKRRKLEESKYVVIIYQDLEKENKQLSYEIDRMKEKLKAFVYLQYPSG